MRWNYSRAHTCQRRLYLAVIAFVAILLSACNSSVNIAGITFGQHRTPRTVVTVANTEPVHHTSGSENWSGYAVNTYNVTSITATWQVPLVSGPSNSDSSTWIGIGGMYSPTLIQAGTDQQVQNGHAYYYAWVEMLPAPPQVLREIDVMPGDIITVTLTQQQGDHWQLQMSDQDANQNVTRDLTYQSCTCSAEWIEEVPSIKGQQTILADFTSVTFTAATATVEGVVQSPSMLRARPIRMIDASGQTLVQPQMLHNDTFSLVMVSGQ